MDIPERSRLRNEDMAKVTATVGIPGNKKVAEGYYKEIKNGPIDNSKYLEGLAGSRLNIWEAHLPMPE